jgi:hypothetical protein
MPIKIEKKANDGSFFPLVLSFSTYAGEEVIPVSVAWTLEDGAGNVVNSRQDVEETPAAEMTIELYGEDIRVADGNERVIIFDTVYLSGGNERPWRESAEFVVVPLK